MAYQVLSTKLFTLPRKQGLVRRPRLVRVLEDGFQAGKHVTLVSAPAGFGKTTVINEWIHATDPVRPYGWVSLDGGDIFLDSTRYAGWHNDGKPVALINSPLWKII